MSSADFIELSSDDKKSIGTNGKTMLDSVSGTSEQRENTKTKSKNFFRKSNTHSAGQESKKNRSSVVFSTSQNESSVLDQGLSIVNEPSPSSFPSFGPAPICRQFWKAGNYDIGEGSKTQLQAIAELLDNAIDEIQNGATFVVMDKTTNPRDGNPALLILGNYAFETSSAITIGW
ncbi:hypothetical protein U1Q18_012480 [Sarracenia purpurea var. burkii]